MQTLADHARTQRLVIFAGAGVSMPAPSSLPNWKALNEAILASLARRLVVFTDKSFAATLLDWLIAERERIERPLQSATSGRGRLSRRTLRLN